MHLSTHYYTLVLGARTNKLHEAFRDDLIEVENQGFPVETPAGIPPSFDHDQLLELARTVDSCFGRYYELDPLGLVVVGEREMESAFRAVTAHESAVIGRIEGDYTATSVRDLGQIVWSVVKTAMSGVLDRAMLDLEASAERGQIACGLESVARLVNAGVQTTLLVEDGYHMIGRIGGTSQSPIISPDVDVRETMDDAVDVVIERVLESGGNVVFTPGGSLKDRNSIVLLPGYEERP